jgi:hypothetical protein
MRGVAAYASDFYFGASATSTGNEENPGNAPATPTTTTAMASQPSAPAIEPVTLLPQLHGLNPLLAIPLLLGAWVILKIVWGLGRKGGEEGHLKLDLIFMLAAGLSGLIVIPAAKAILQKYKFPVVSAYVANA